MQNHYKSTLIKKHPRLSARIMRFETPHGTVETPHFMPVGTRAMLNYLTPADLEQNGSQIILGGNTYHMLVAPGMDVIQKAGGMHPFMGWHRAMLTDSGGFQVLSLSKNGKICIVDEEGAHFKHPNSGKIIHLNAETSIQTQMETDETKHRDDAQSAGARELPAPVKVVMQCLSKVMVKTAYYV